MGGDAREAWFRLFLLIDSAYAHLIKDAPSLEAAAALVCPGVYIEWGKQRYGLPSSALERRVQRGVADWVRSNSSLRCNI